MNDMVKTNTTKVEVTRVEGSDVPVDFYATKCNCGAITIDSVVGAEEKFSCSMTQDTFDDLCVDNFTLEWMNECYNCNHCVNHWGIDICKCGSGDPIGECTWDECPHTENKEAMQEFLSPQQILLLALMKNRGGLI